MATYIALVNYTDKGIANIKDSPSRLDKARALLREMGGDFKQVFLTMGAHDLVVVYEAPDDVPRSIVPPLEPLPRRTPATSGADMETVRARAAVELLQDFRTTPPRLDRHRSR